MQQKEMVSVRTGMRQQYGERGCTNLLTDEFRLYKQLWKLNSGNKTEQNWEKILNGALWK